MTKAIDDAYQAIVSWWRAQHISQRDELASVLEGYRVRFAYHSGTIENPELTYHDTREIFDHDGVTSKTWARQIERAEAKRTAGSDTP